MASSFFYTFPAIRGIQATREYYVVMCPMRLIPKMLLFDEQELSPELRSQRVLNKARIPSIKDYIVNNPTEYVFSALTASIDAEVEFKPVSSDPVFFNVGHLKVPMTARFVINDGQHRRAAIEAALKECSELGDETIACVFFIDTGLKRSQQMFADLNRYAIRTTQSLNILYDYRDPLSQLVKEVVRAVPVFNGMTEIDKSTISNRSPKLFTLSGIYNATKELLTDYSDKSVEEQLQLAKAFWIEVSINLSEWNAVKAGAISAAALRRDYIHAHTVTLVAIGYAGRALLEHYADDWKSSLAALKNINWHRSNVFQWEGRALVGGKVSISRNNQILVTNEIKKILGLPLNESELNAETAFLRARAENQ